MKRIIFLLTIILSLAMSAEAKDRTAFVDSCNGDKTGYTHAKAACKSGEFSGKTIVECVQQCADKKFLQKCKAWEWKKKKHVECSQDDEKKGVYIGSCSGDPTGHDNVEGACASGDYNGLTAYYCKWGKEKKRLYCEGKRDDGYEDKYGIFVDTCQGESTGHKTNLSKACNENPQKLLVKCKHECVEKKGLKCVARNWKSIKSRQCGLEDAKDTAKIKNCTPDEVKTIVSGIEAAKPIVADLITEVGAALEQDYSKGTTRKLKKAKRKLENISDKLGKAKKYQCLDRSASRCRHGRWGQTAGFNVNICPDLFTDADSDRDVASLIIHELAHQTGIVGDPAYFSSITDVPKDTGSRSWASIADTYGYWADYGFCVPEVNCPPK